MISEANMREDWINMFCSKPEKTFAKLFSYDVSEVYSRHAVLYIVYKKKLCDICHSITVKIPKKNVFCR